MNLRVLVCGWYGQGNLGDDLFVDAFKHIFPEYQFTFTYHIKLQHLENIDAVFIGGGSFIGESLKIDANAFDEIKKKKICYIGVGAETSIHESHQQLISLAKIVAIRSSAHLEYITRLNPNTMVIPDIVYSLPVSPSTEKVPQSVLFIPNVSVVPKWDHPHWKHAAWEYFKIETSQMLDSLIKDKYTVKFLPFCINNKLNDSYAAAEIINRMSEAKGNLILEKPTTLAETIDLISKYQITITQRFHGTVLSDMAQTPSLTIHHHDKLKNSAGSKVSYYSSNKNLLLEEIKPLLDGKKNSILPIDSNIFIELKERVEDAICRSQK